MTTRTWSPAAAITGLATTVFGVLSLLTTIGTTPAVAQPVTLTRVGVIPGPAEHVRVQGEDLYVSHHINFMI